MLAVLIDLLIGLLCINHQTHSLNCIYFSYVPWNLHEPERGVFDFGDGGRDLSPFLNLTRFLNMAKEEDLFVVFRPGEILQLNCYFIILN